MCVCVLCRKIIIISTCRRIAMMVTMTIMMIITITLLAIKMMTKMMIMKVFRAND